MAKANNEKREYYNEVKDFNGQKYSGMAVGGVTAGVMIREYGMKLKLPLINGNSNLPA